MDTTEISAPPGFEPLTRSSPFMDLLQPIHVRQQESKLTLGFLCAEKHCNARGFIHGGVLSTLADIALGYNCVFAMKKAQSLVTTNLNIDFVGSAKIGDWIEVDVTVQKVGSTLAFANCYFVANEKRIARASAIFCRPKQKQVSD